MESHCGKGRAEFWLLVVDRDVQADGNKRNMLVNIYAVLKLLQRQPCSLNQSCFAGICCSHSYLAGGWVSSFPPPLPSCFLKTLVFVIEAR